MLDFNPFHFGSTFRSSPYYNGDLNGFDVMVMESAEKADQIIENAKAAIDDFAEAYAGTGITFSFSYNSEDILEPDQIRINEEIKKYCRFRNISVR